MNASSIPSFFDFSLKELELYVDSKGFKPFRARQLFKWVYEKWTLDPNEMTDLSKDFRKALPDLLRFELLKTKDEMISTDGTRKFLVEVGDKPYSVECVAIPSKDRITLCVSSEVGCNLGCTFCYTGKQKLKYRLSAGEIVGQFYELQRRLALAGEQKITNIVFMGMGEPLDNEEAVFKSISILREPIGIGLSRKKITVSTSGLVSKIPLVANSGVRLAVSLNASNDKTRSEIMPINKKWNIADLSKACKEFSEATSDKITLEYVLLKGVTDSLEDARALHKIASRFPSMVNIIPFNPYPGADFLPPAESQINRFQKELMHLGTHTMRRRTMGQDILGACGQLTSAKS